MKMIIAIIIIIMKYSLHIGLLKCFNIVFWFILKITFPQNSSGKGSEHQAVWIQISPYILSGLIWVQNVSQAEDIMNIIKYYNFN